VRHEGQWILIEGPFEKVPTHNKGNFTVFWPDFYEVDSGSFLVGQRVLNLKTEALRKVLLEFLGEGHRESSKDSQWTEPSKEDFREAFNVIQELILKGDLVKAVPTYFSHAKLNMVATDKAQYLLHLLEAPQELFVYGLWFTGQGVLGATPETLFEYSDGLLKTMALAGTCPRAEALIRSRLLDDEKEMREHQLVVKDLERQLSQYGPVSVRGPRILELPTLLHLQSELEVQCHGVPDFFALIKNLHPTPALGVAPREFGYQWMRALPGQEGRGGFGAPFAFFTNEKALCLVAIRNLQWNKNTAMIGSGCGIVKGSEFEREWRELEQKRLSVKKILGL